MEAHQIYAIATSGWLTLKASLHLLAPKLLLTALNDEPRKATYAEVYFTRSVGLAIFTLALLMLFLSGLVPLGSSDTTLDERKPSPYADGMIKITMLYHAAAAFQSYTSYAVYKSASLGLSTFASCTLAAMGLWCIMFGGSGHISRRTGRDKRTSGWPFQNIQADKKLK